MTTENDADRPTASLCLRVVAELDPSALTRILGFFHNLNVIPRRVIAERGSRQDLFIRIDVSGLPEDRLSLIAAKAGQLPGIGNAYWHRV